MRFFFKTKDTSLYSAATLRQDAWDHLNAAINCLIEANQYLDREDPGANNQGAKYLNDLMIQRIERVTQ